MAAGQDAIWMCVRNQSSFLRKNKNVPTMTAEPANLLGWNMQKYSGLAHKKAVDVHPMINGKKENIILTAKALRGASARSGKRLFAATGMSKGAKSLTCPHVVAYAKKLISDDDERHRVSDKVFEEADTDGSGDLSPHEVVELVHKTCKDMKLHCVPPMAKILELVEKVDKNHDGSLSKMEFRTGFTVVLKSCVHKAEESAKTVKTLDQLIHHRPDLAGEAVEKYHKVKKSFKKKKLAVKSRRAGK